MNNEDEVIEILDDFEGDTITMSPINKVVQTPIPNTNQEVPANVIVNQSQSINNDLKVGNQEENTYQFGNYEEAKKLADVEYSPIEPEKQEIKIETETEDNSKSGIGFIIVLFILLIAFILALPYISKLF